MRFLMLALALLLAGLDGSSASARAFTVDDLLGQEGLGQVVLDPTGLNVAVERRGPYAASARFDLGHHSPDAGTRLLLVSLETPVQARPLMPQSDGYGYLLGPWSPDGRRLAVYRLGVSRWELGVVDVPSGEVRWLDLTPASLPGRNLQWRSSDELIVLAAQDRPAELRRISQGAAQLPGRWAASAAGFGAHTVIGSGAWRHLSPRPKPAQVVLVDARSGGARVLAVGAFTEIKPASSGPLIALLERGEPLQPASARSPQGDWGVASEASRLALLDTRTGVLSYPCSGRDVLATLLSWAPTAERLLIFARPDGAPWTSGKFYVAGGGHGCQQLDGRGFTPLLHRRPEVVETAWLADQPIVRGQGPSRSNGRLDWWRLSQDAPVNLTGGLPQASSLLGAHGDGLVLLSGSRLWRLGAKGQAHRLKGRPVTSVAWRAADLSHASESIWAALLLRDAGGGLHTPERPIGFALAPGERVVSYSAAAQVLLVQHTNSHGVSILEARKEGCGASLVMRLNEAFADVDPLRVRPIKHPGPDGQQLTSWLYLPARGPIRPALIVRPYLGDDYATTPSPRAPVLGLAADVRVLVGEGYAVLTPSLPLSMDNRAPLHGLAKRVIDIVDAAARQAPGEFDPERLAIWGHSYGGYTTMGVIGQTDRFKAAISMNAPTDLIGIYGTFQPSWRISPEDGVWASWPSGWAEDSQGRMGAPPWRAAARYIENSPLFLAETIRTPVMLIHADQDPVPLTQAEEMFSALYRQNKDAVIVTYWGEGHIISSPANVRDLYRRSFEWLEHYLAPAS